MPKRQLRVCSPVSGHCRHQAKNLLIHINISLVNMHTQGPQWTNIPPDMHNRVMQSILEGGNLRDIKHASEVQKKFAKLKHSHLLGNLLQHSDHFLVSRLLHTAIKYSMKNIRNNQGVTDIIITLGAIGNSDYNVIWKYKAGHWILECTHQCLTKQGDQAFRDQYLKELPQDPADWTLLHLARVFGATSDTLFHNMFIQIRDDVQRLINSVCNATTKTKISEELKLLNVRIMVAGPSGYKECIDTPFKFIDTIRWPANQPHGSFRAVPEQSGVCLLLERLKENMEKHYESYPANILFEDKSVFPHLNIQCLTKYYKFAESLGNYRDLVFHIGTNCKTHNNGHARKYE